MNKTNLESKFVEKYKIKFFIYDLLTTFIV